MENKYDQTHLIIHRRVLDALTALASDKTWLGVISPLDSLHYGFPPEPLSISSEFDAELATRWLSDDEYDIPDDHVRTLTAATLAAWKPLARDARNLAQAGSALPPSEARQFAELSAALRLLRSEWHRRGMDGARWLMGRALQFRCTEDAKPCNSRQSDAVHPIENQ
jgi:hypothetical protein